MTASSLQQLMATTALLVTCERIVASGHLPADEEQNLRLLIARVCRVYQIDSIAERGPLKAANDSDFEAQLERISRALNVVPRDAS